MTDKKISLTIDTDAWIEATNINDGVFSPLPGFMDSKDYHSVVDEMRLVGGQPWTIPVTLEAPEDLAPNVIKAEKVELVNPAGAVIGEVVIEDVFKVDYQTDLIKIFGTDSLDHPGVQKESARSRYRVGGQVTLHESYKDSFDEHYYTPETARRKFKENSWETIVGFQTRNPIHRSHEYLQRIGLELADGLFIQPLIGWKKKDDFTPRAIVATYMRMFERHYPNNRAMFGTLVTPMRYAGPREAVFHAIIRKNFGCTHFIVGRDHAGVGGFYEKYAAHRLCRSFPDLGIEVLTLAGPYYCEKCDAIVTEKTCPHGEAFAIEISGTDLRQMLRNGQRPPLEYMRDDIAETLIELSRSNALFISEAGQ